MAASASEADADTIPKLLLRNAQARGGRPANREKHLGIWQTWSWAQVAEETRALSLGLMDLGLARGDKVAIIGDNRPKLYWAFAAVQALGAVPVPIYQDSVPEEMSFVLTHAGARFAIVEDQEQVDKLLSVDPQDLTLDHVIYEDERGMRHYDDPRLKTYAAVQAAGRARAKAEPTRFADETAKGAGEDVAVILYTSGTTGRPKGVVLTHDACVTAARLSCAFEGLTDREEMLAYLPMAWVGDHIFSYAQAYYAGFCVSCPESPDTMLADLRELGPTFFFAPPRIFENILTSVMIRIEDASKLKRNMFHRYMEVAKRVGPAILDGAEVDAKDRRAYWLGERLVYGPLKNVLGFTKLRLAYTAGEAIGPEIFQFFRSLGVNLKQLYGQTEAGVFVTIQPDGAVRADTVGVPAPEVEVRIAEDGEVLYRSRACFREYYKNPDATTDTKDAEGWVRTGDAGFFDDEGHLRILDRAKDVGKLNDGALFAPKYIENKLKFYPNIKEAVAFGHGRDHVACFLNIDLNAVGNWAERNNVSYASYQELAAHPDVYAMIAEHVAQVNRDLAADPKLASSQIRRFLILHKELDADDGELTRTSKVRRSFIAERYGELVDALYSGAPRVRARTEVTYEDGRKGVLEGDVEIRDAEPVAAPVAQAAE